MRTCRCVSVCVCVYHVMPGIQERSAREVQNVLLLPAGKIIQHDHNIAAASVACELDHKAFPLRNVEVSEFTPFDFVPHVEH